MKPEGISVIGLDRASRTPLTEQLAAALKADVIRGRLGPGDVLPGIVELARRAAVSEKVSRGALARLAAEGWTAPRRGVGSVVLERGRDCDRLGRVLIFTFDTGISYYTSSLVSAIRSRLIRSRYRVHSITAIERQKADGCRQLENVLRDRWDLVLENGYAPRTRQVIESSGWPFAILGVEQTRLTSAAANFRGAIRFSGGRCLPDLVLACVRARIGRILQIRYEEHGAFDAANMLKAAGIAVESVVVPRQSLLENVSRAGLQTVDALLRKGRRAWPDLIVFNDDYLAQGGLLALATHGVRMPDDIRVCSLVNRGLCPVCTPELTRIEMDPFAHGEAVARAALAFLRGGGFPQDLVLGSTWKPGRTF